MATPIYSLPGTHWSTQSRRTHASQSGVVLIVALVMLVVISLASVAIMKGAINTDSVADNNRRQGQAMQGAQAGLRYCENQVTSGSLTPSAAVSTVATEDWKDFNKWKRGAQAPKKPVPADFLAKEDSGAPAVANPPECMAQFRALGTTQVVVVTSRGFSDNYVENDQGRTQAGSVVWLQSILQLAANSTP
ncbi:MAG: hypothetical protein HY836_07560 [Aquabacterium sp.]|uniref:pilus assembly PilX family protein n=1 Tax=Aquabacterium sp. TaxID=1872578 RepID=UPI0025B9A1CA|nr:PilX N-terminal domain-containing pilus assembly protein [Aquabacterium sp.]MBI5925444.1 hypothetical protein [Aquabacterium sp.]